MQRINGFQLCESLPTPNSFLQIQESLKQVINFIDCKEKSEKLKLIENINVHRSYEILMQFKKYESLKKALGLLRENF